LQRGMRRGKALRGHGGAEEMAEGSMRSAAEPRRLRCRAWKAALGARARRCKCAPRLQLRLRRGQAQPRLACRALAHRPPPLSSSLSPSLAARTCAALRHV
jgi:hypothetical protein